MLKYINEYKISNPYRTAKHQQAFPHDLSSQLKKLDYLSQTTISMLSFQKEDLENSNPDSLLLKMKKATSSQEDRYGSLYGFSGQIAVENPEEEEGDSVSSQGAKDQGEREEVISTREQLSMSNFQFNNNLLDCREMYYEDLNLLESNSCSNMKEMKAPGDEEMVIIDEDFEHYFVN